MKVSSIVFAIMLFTVNISFAAIIKTNDFKIIENNIQTTNTDTLLIFDVDDVLLQPKDQLLKSHNEGYFEKIYQSMETRTNKNQAEKLFSLIMIQRKVEPVEKQIVKLVNTAQKNGIKVLALTFCSTGKLGTINSLEDWRIQELKVLGYNFDKSWNKLTKKIFNQLPINKLNKFVAFQQGIIFTGGVSKAAALNVFLNYADHKPKKIIFVDDKKYNLEIVEKFAKETNIEFLGIEYTFVQDSKIEPLNKTRARLQLEILEKEYKWLSDQEIDLKIID